MKTPRAHAVVIFGVKHIKIESVEQLHHLSGDQWQYCAGQQDAIQDNNS